MGVSMKPWRTVNTIVANRPGVGNAVYAKAQQIGAKAEGRLLLHDAEFPEDTTEASVTVTRGSKRVDSFISLEDTGGEVAAMSIEFGYRAVNGRIVHGLHIVTGAAGLA